MSADHEFVCKECGFTVSCDNEGVELLQQHLAVKHPLAAVEDGSWTDSTD